MNPAQAISAIQKLVGDDPLKDRTNALFPFIEHAKSDDKIALGMGTIPALCDHAGMTYEDLMSLHKEFSKGDVGLTYAVIRAFHVGYTPVVDILSAIRNNDYTSIDEAKVWSFINAVIPSIGRTY